MYCKNHIRFKIHYMYLRCPLIWCEIEPNERLASYQKKFQFANRRITCMYDSYFFNVALSFYRTMKEPHGIAPNGHSCGISMVIKF